MYWIIFIVSIVIIIYLLSRKKERKLDLSLLPKQFIVLDLETTGLYPSKHEIIEIGAIKVNRDSNNHSTFQALIKPQKPISKEITDITGITQKMVEKKGEDLESVMKEFIEFIGDLRLVAYNAKFDMGFLDAAANRVGLNITNEYSCALEMARRAWPRLRSYKLVNLAKKGNLSTTGTHRALKDCELTMIVYTSAVSKLNSLS